MMRAGGAQPVVGIEEEGPAAPPQAEPEELADPSQVELSEREREPVEESPYIRFGERILVRELDDGITVVTKPYYLPAGRPAKIVQLLGAMEPFGFRQRSGPDEEGVFPPFEPTLVEYQILEKLDEEFYTVFPKFDESPAAPTSVVVSDVMVVTATPELLVEFEDFLDLFTASGVPQIEIEAKIIEIVERDTLDVGVDATFTFGSANFVKQFAFDLPNFAESSEALLTLGAIQNSLVFDGILEAVKSWQNVSIESRPRTVVRAGGVARLDSTQEIPYLDIKTLAPDGTFTASIAYKTVGTQLWVSPRMVGANTLALDVYVQGSQQVGNEVTVATAAGGVIDTPIIAYRTAKTVVYLEPGQTLVIGGLTEERDSKIISKVPILGDIPLLGFFFRSTFTVKERQHVLFAISPRIIQRSDFETEL